MRFLIDSGAETSIINSKICNPKWKINPNFRSIKVLNRTIKPHTCYKFPIFKEFNESDKYLVEFVEYDFHTFFDGLVGNNILFG